MQTQPFAAALRQLCTAVPFTPFVLEWVTGERILIHHPEAVRLEGDLATYVESEQELRFFDATSIVQLRIKLGAIDPGGLDGSEP